MENSENQDNKGTEHKILPIKNLSGDQQMKQLSVNPTDTDNDIHIIGFNIQVDDNQEYSFTLDKPRSKWAEILTTAADSNESTGQELTEFHQVENEGTRDSTSSENVLKEDIFKQPPALKLKFGSNCSNKEEFEVHIKSKNCSSVKEQQYLKEDRLEKDNLIKVTPGGDGSPSVRYLKESPAVALKHNTAYFETENVSGVTSFQTTNADAISSKNLKETFSKPEDTCNVSVETQRKMANLEGIETDHISIKQPAVRTEKQIVSHAETVAVFSVEKNYDVSTQTKQTGNAATSTDCSICLIDSGNTAEKSTDTGDFPPEPPMTAEEEKTKIEENKTGELCQCSCGHTMQHDCIYKCCYHFDSENIIPTNILLGQNLQYLGSMNTASRCGYCRCRLNRRCSEVTNDCAEKLKSDVHPRYCCECTMHVKIVKDSSTSMDEIENVENSDSIELNNSDSLAFQKSIFQQPQVEIVNSSETIKEKDKTYDALKAFRSGKSEKVHLLEKRSIFELCLNSSSLSKVDESNIEINPIDITLNEKMATESLSEEHLKSKTQSLTNNNQRKDKERNSDLPVFGETQNGSTRDSSKEPLMLASYYSYSGLCPCNVYHSDGETVHKKENSVLLKKSSRVVDNENSKSFKKQFRSTSPKITSAKFDYISKDEWKPYNYKTEEFSEKKIGATDIIQIEKTSDEEHLESFIQGLNDACAIVNDHLLSLRPVDEHTVRKAAELLHKQWFEIVGSKYPDLNEVRHYIQYFKDFSNNLLKTLLHSVDNNGNNVLHFAFANSRFDLIDELLQNGFALDLLSKGNKSGNTPLMISSISQPISHSEWTVVRKCFEFSDVNQKSSKNGQTPLMNAASSGFQEMVDLLLDIGANPNLKDKDGSTALMYAAEHGHEKCIKSLVRHKKCDPTITDKDGETACSIALSNGHKNIAVLIHMQAIEKRTLLKNLNSTKRFIWRNHYKTARKKL